MSNQAPVPSTSLLAAFERLSPSSYLYIPPQVGPQARPSRGSVSHPSLIILMTWMSASPMHISKYIKEYQARFPNSCILTITSDPADYLLRPTFVRRRCIAPAVKAIVASCYPSAPSTRAEVLATPDIILHVFSNGGCYQALNLLTTYQLLSRPCHVFPQHLTILDSCPGRGTFALSVRALSSALPQQRQMRFLLSVFVYVIVSAYWLALVPWGTQDPIERTRRRLNDRQIVQGEVLRKYLYSDVDTMVPSREVVLHARDAEDNGFKFELERFKGTAHCAHIRADGGQRYWAIVQDAWTEACAIPH